MGIAGQRVCTASLVLLAATVALLVSGCAPTGIGGLQNADGVSAEDIAAASLSDLSVLGAALRVAWGTPNDTPLDPVQRAGYIVGYEVYRSTTPVVSPDPRALVEFVEGGRSVTLIDAVASPGAPEHIDLATSDTGLVAVNRSAGSGTASVTYASDAITYEIVPTPPTPGTFYYYGVRAITKKLAAQPFEPAGGTPNLAGTLTTSPLFVSGRATVVPPPTLVMPPNDPDPGSKDVNLATSLFEWQATPGADTYRIELSTDRTFPAANRMVSRELVVSAQGGQATVSSIFEGGNAAQAFANVKGLVYWRVGARNSRDRYYPMDRNGDPVSFVYSEPRGFSALEIPPPQP